MNSKLNKNIKYCLADLGNISTGCTPSKKNSDNYSDVGIPFIKPDIFVDDKINVLENANEYVSDTGIKAARCAQKGDILVTCIGNIGKLGIVNSDKVCFNQQINAINTNDKVLPRYLAYNLMYNKKRMQDLANAPIVPILNKSNFSNFQISIHNSINQQTEIETTLDCIQKIIESKNKQLEKLDVLIKVRFVEMFGDIITNTKCWNVDIFENVTHIINGKNQKKVQNENGQYLICGSGGPMGRATDYLVNENSIIIGRKGNINNPILMKEKFWNVDTAFGIEPKRECINEIYLYNFCVFYDFTKHNKTVTIPSLTKKDIISIKVPIPPLSLQNQFADFVKQVEATKASVKKSLDKTQMLFDSLMQEYFG